MDFMAFLEQMGTSDIAVVAAFFIGLMTAISPCPMATNMTAIAYISKKMGSSRHTLFVGLLYACGRAFAYAALASLIVYIGINTRGIAFFLQEYGEKLLGPLLILIGLVALDLIKLDSFTCGGRLTQLQIKASETGYLGAFLLGVLLSLAFCPFSAVLYFGMLIPLALKTGDAILLPSVFGLATGLPVILCSVLLVKSVSELGRAMDKVQQFERIIRLMAGAAFVLAGLYYIFTRVVVLWLQIGF